MLPVVWLFFVCCVSVPGLAQKVTNTKQKTFDPFGWNTISSTARPATFWWWLGSCVNEKEIERQLIVLKEAGFGGVTICPLYEYKDPTVPPIKYLSQRWVDVFRFALKKASELGLFVDMTTGGGWPIGGPWVTRENSERDWRFEILELDLKPGSPVVIRDEGGKDPIKCVTILERTCDPKGYTKLVTSGPARVVESQVEDGKPVWKLPQVGKCFVLVARMGYSGSNVYVAGDGGKGPVFDYWSPKAFENLVGPLDSLLEKTGGLRPRAVYCDSFEGQGGTTPGFFEAFEKVNHYDVRPYMHQFLAETSTPENIRLWHDYRATIAFLHLGFVKRWRQWANQNGMLTRYQYTGDPANPLNTCGEADIPEDAPPFNTSAAHIFGKKLISAEEFTWGAGHNFKDYLDFYRKRGDIDLMQGLNHKVYHGTPFTPLSEPWPGPMYYAGGNFSETQPFFRHIRYLNEYFGRLQQTLQDSKPQSDVLMLWSVHDFWNMVNLGGFYFRQPFVWRNSNSAIYREDIKIKTRTELVGMGIQTDLCSDEIITGQTTVVNGQIKAGELTCKVLVVPETMVVGAKTLKKLETLAREGGAIIFMKNIPVAVPESLPLVQDTRESAQSLESMAKTSIPGKSGVFVVSDMTGLVRILGLYGINADGVAGKLSTYRIKQGDRTIYLIRNNTNDYLDLWVPLVNLDSKNSGVLVGNPRTGAIARATQRPCSGKGKLVHLVFEPSELLVVTDPKPIEKWKKIEVTDYRKKNNIKQVGGNWKISWADYEGTQHQINCDTLKSWTEWPDLGLFSGLVTYETSFTMNDNELKNKWVLDAGRVCESAEVYVNGQKVGCVWTTPFQIDVSDFLKQGLNVLKAEVVNKAQNRIIAIHRQGIPWQKSKLEAVSEDYSSSGPLQVDQLKPVLSGLLGPVILCSPE